MLKYMAGIIIISSKSNLLRDLPLYGWKTSSLQLTYNYLLNNSTCIFYFYISCNKANFYLYLYMRWHFSIYAKKKKLFNYIFLTLSRKSRDLEDYQVILFMKNSWKFSYFRKRHWNCWQFNSYQQHNPYFCPCVADYFLQVFYE